MLKRAGTLMTLAFTLATCQDKLLSCLYDVSNYFHFLFLGPH